MTALFRQILRSAVILLAAGFVVFSASILERSLPVPHRFGPPRPGAVPRPLVFRKRKREPAVAAGLPEFALQLGLIGGIALAGRKVLHLRLM